MCMEDVGGDIQTIEEGNLLKFISPRTRTLRRSPDQQDIIGTLARLQKTLKNVARSSRHLCAKVLPQLSEDDSFFDLNGVTAIATDSSHFGQDVQSGGEGFQCHAQCNSVHIAITRTETHGQRHAGTQTRTARTHPSHTHTPPLPTHTPPTTTPTHPIHA